MVLTGPRRFRKDHSRPRVRRRSSLNYLGLRGSGEPRTPGRADDGPEAVERSGGHRRGPTASGPVSCAPCPRGPKGSARSFLGSGECIRGLDAPDLGKFGWAHGVVDHRWVLSEGTRSWWRGVALGERRLPSVLPGERRCGQSGLEEEFHSDPAGAGPSSWGVRVPATALRRFWTILAHYHGQTWNAAEAARALGASESTARRYLDILSDAFMIRQLQPYHANLRKRQVNHPRSMSGTPVCSTIFWESSP